MGCEADGVCWNLSVQQDRVLGRNAAGIVRTSSHACTADLQESKKTEIVFEDEIDRNTKAYLDAGSDVGVWGYEV